MSGFFSSNEGFVERKKKKNHKKVNERDWIKLENNGSEIKQSPWGELDEDLLTEIKNRLTYSDQVRFYTVCKNWLAVKQFNTKPLPWVINITYPCANSFMCKLYEPSYSSNLVEPTMVHECPSCLCCISNTIHKYGWIFCSATDQWSGHTNFLLLSPFTKKSINLPPKSNWATPFLNTFSIDPNSPDCVFLLLYDNFSDNTISVKTFCHKYKYWMGRTFDRPEKIEMCGQFPVYINGIFYFVFPSGKLASYNVDRLEWKVECVTDYGTFPQNFLEYRIYEGFELNGVLMLICIRWDDSGFIARFDWFKKAWVLLESLGNHSLFCTNGSILVSPIGKEERSKGVLPNKVYYGEQVQDCSVYSLECGKLTKLMNRSGIRSWDQTVTSYCGHWFEPPLSWDIRRKNNPKKSILPVSAKQCPNGTDIDIVNGLVNLKMDKTGEQSMDDEDDDELESMRMLDQMRRSRNVARDNNTAAIKLYDSGKKRNLRTN